MNIITGKPVPKTQAPLFLLAAVAWILASSNLQALEPRTWNDPAGDHARNLGGPNFDFTEMTAQIKGSDRLSVTFRVAGSIPENPVTQSWRYGLVIDVDHDPAVAADAGGDLVLRLNKPSLQAPWVTSVQTLSGAAQGIDPPAITDFEINGDRVSMTAEIPGLNRIGKLRFWLNSRIGGTLVDQTAPCALWTTSRKQKFGPIQVFAFESTLGKKHRDRTHCDVREIHVYRTSAHDLVFDVFTLDPIPVQLAKPMTIALHGDIDRNQKTGYRFGGYAFDLKWSMRLERNDRQPHIVTGTREPAGIDFADFKLGACEVDGHRVRMQLRYPQLASLPAFVSGGSLWEDGIQVGTIPRMDVLLPEVGSLNVGDEDNPGTPFPELDQIDAAFTRHLRAIEDPIERLRRIYRNELEKRKAEAVRDQNHDLTAIIVAEIDGFRHGNFQSLSSSPDLEKLQSLYQRRLKEEAEGSVENAVKLFHRYEGLLVRLEADVTRRNLPRQTARVTRQLTEFRNMKQNRLEALFSGTGVKPTGPPLKGSASEVPLNASR